MNGDPPDRSWLPAPADLTLAADEVHIWRATLAQPAAAVYRLQQTLDAGEIQRAGRFHFERDRRDFVVARGILRDILGRYLGAASDRLRFRYNAHGKPALEALPGQETFCFNISHTAGLALFAVARTEVGVDIEEIRNGVEYAAAARPFFSPQEIAVLDSLPHEMQVSAFFACWVRKEAYVKARGVGLAQPLDQFAVSLLAGAPTGLLYARDDAGVDRRWRLQALDAGQGYAAALAVAGRPGQLRYWQWRMRAASES